MRPLALLPSAAALLLGCAPTAEIAFCDGEQQHVYDPAVALTAWPDDHWTVADPSTRTGLRLAPDPDAPALAHFPDVYRGTLEEAAAVDGAATSAALFLQTSRALPEDLDGLTVELWTETDGAWRRHDHSRWRARDQRTLFVRPWRPLPPTSRGVLAVHTDLPDGACIAPSATLRDRLTNAEDPLRDRSLDALNALGWGPADVGMMTVFTTQSAGLDDGEVLADVDARPLALDAPMACTDDGDRLVCDGAVTVADYRDPTTRVVPAGEPLVERDAYALPVRLWLPADGGAGAPYPVVFCGHHLGGTVHGCRAVSRLAAAQGVATVAVDAQEHGDHPRRTATDNLISTTLALTGISLDPPGLTPLVLRDNMRQSAWDKLQVLRAIQAGWDVDGDGTDDLDGGRVLYSGISLGGIMAPQFLALAPEIEAAALAVPGGGLMDLWVESETLAVITEQMVPPEWSDDDLARALPLLQALVDAGEPLVFAEQITRRRADERQADVAMLMALDDAIVPNPATARLTQAFDVPVLGVPLLGIPGVDAVPGPVRGNLADGATGALLQLAEVQPSGGQDWGTATHLTVPTSAQWDSLVDAFVATLSSDDAPEVAVPARE